MIMLKSTHEVIVEDFRRAITQKDIELSMLRDDIEFLKAELQDLLNSKQLPPEGKPVGGLRGWRNAKAEFDTRQRLIAAAKPRPSSNNGN